VRGTTDEIGTTGFGSETSGQEAFHRGPCDGSACQFMRYWPSAIPLYEEAATVGDGTPLH
jgi:hypothetical protein